jgi:hypothetical protein
MSTTAENKEFKNIDIEKTITMHAEIQN